jgi:hypothetical protein
MSAEKILLKVTLTEKYQPTGRTVHRRDGALIRVPSALAIAQLAGDPGFYLYYFDSNGKELTDTYHLTIEQAQKQASFEFGVEESDWRSA